MANLALLLWPLVVIILFYRLSLPVAVTVSVVGGYLLLPTDTAWDFPFLPPIDKNIIPALAATVMAVAVTAGNRNALRALERSGMTTPPTGAILSGWIPRAPIPMMLFGLVFVGVVMTTLTNGQPAAAGGRILQALRPYDAVSTGAQTLGLLLPLMLGRKYLGHPDAHRTVLIVLCVAGLAYSLLALYEVRMSPQLNRMVYGFFPHSWLQHFRQGGWRPIVFLDHGLLVGIFFACTLLAAASLVRTARAEKRVSFIIAALWLGMTLVLVKTLGALLIALVLLPVVLLGTVRPQLLVAAALAGVVLLYPMLRGSDLIPTNWILSITEHIDPGRTASLAFRFQNEDALLERANQQPIFGWGGWGRSRVYNEAGAAAATTDGYWVITIGVSGWVGYVAKFGMLTLPMILLVLRRRAYEITLATSCLALVLVANLVDLLPNASNTPMLWLLGGALMGRLEWGRVTESAADAVTVSDIQGASRLRYTRAANMHHRSS